MRARPANAKRRVETLPTTVGEGRITMAESEQRAQAVYAARARRELGALTDDLPWSLW